MMKEPILSERFDLDDIRKLRDYNSWRYSQMTHEEIIADIRMGAEAFQKKMDEHIKNRESKKEA